MEQLPQKMASERKSLILNNAIKNPRFPGVFYYGATAEVVDGLSLLKESAAEALRAAGNHEASPT